jgi:phosphatidate cytidylyltransferase
VEGALGGLAAGVVFGTAVFCCLPGYKLWQVMLFALIVSAASQLGDLIVSAWKRSLGIKDFSRMLGSHGGVIDRFDSVVFAAGVFYLLVTGPQILK